jgi:acetate CoA/acetoacetate CoA-transferase beta subunit
MDKSLIKGFIAARCAKELKDGDVVNLGIGLPTLIPAYLPEGVELVIHAELGIVGAGANPKPGDDNYLPYHVTDAGGAPASVAFDGCFTDSATNFGLIRGGHVDACFLGALEVDAEGSLANWIIPGKKMPGMGGAMDLCTGAKKCIICMEHTAKGNPKIFEKCRLPLTASHCVNKIITEMCVLEVTPDGLLMTEINPEFTVEDVKAATAAPVAVAENLKSMVD